MWAFNTLFLLLLGYCSALTSEEGGGSGNALSDSVIIIYLIIPRLGSLLKRFRHDAVFSGGPIN